MPKTDISVDELVKKVQRKELVLPEMQRKYVWPATRVRDLLDSLYRGYPSGSILAWETDEVIDTRELAVHATNTPTTSQKLLLLDGQQRITSLAAILSGEPVHVRNRTRPIDILFNLEHPEGPPVETTELSDDNLITEIEGEEDAERDIQEEMKKRTFVVASRALENIPTWVSVSGIFKMTDTEILRPIGINSDSELWQKYVDRLQKVRKIRDYQYVMQQLERDKSYEEVTEIFVRVNSLGVKLRSSDLAIAQITSKWRGFMSLLEAFTDEFSDNRDYILDSGLPVRLMVIFATHQSKFKTVGRIKRETLEACWEKAQDGLRYAVNFLKSNARASSWCAGESEMRTEL